MANQKNEARTCCSWRSVPALNLFTALPDWQPRCGGREADADCNGSSLAINNPTPFYITVSRISRDGGKALNSKTVMLAPQSSQTVALSSAVNRGETLTVNNINDYGADVAVKVAVK